MIGIQSTVLSERHVVNMLLYLYDKGKVKESQLTAVVKNYYSAVDVATKLVDSGLVDSWFEKDGHTVKIYTLTNLGSLVAEDIKHANDKILAAGSSDGMVSETPAGQMHNEAFANKRPKDSNRGGG